MLVQDPIAHLGAGAYAHPCAVPPAVRAASAVLAAESAQYGGHARGHAGQHWCILCAAGEWRTFL